MPRDTGEILLKISENGRFSYPFVPKISFDDVYGVSSGTQELAKEAVDVPIKALGGGTIKAILFWDADNLNDEDFSSGKISVKINGASVPLLVAPVLVLSQDISSITASNSSTTVTKKLKWSFFAV